MSGVSFKKDGSIKRTEKPISFAVLDLDFKIQHQDNTKVNAILPVWRWFWIEITSAGDKIDFLNSNHFFKDGLIAQLTNKNYDVLLVHIDSYIPAWFFSFMSFICNTGMDISILLCGYLPTIKSEELLKAMPGVQMILTGPLESSLRNFCDLLKKDYPIYYINKISRVDQKDFKNLFLNDSVGVIQASAGCPMSCSFCRYSSFYHRYYNGIYVQYPMESVVSEISELYYKYDIKHFRFSDSNFLGTGKLAYKRAVELAEGLLKNNLEITFEMHCRSDTLLPEVISKLKSCGLRYLSIGIESMSSNQLRRFEKRETISDHIAAVDLIQKNGLAAQGYCILAEPLVTRRELMENLEGLYELSKKILILINEKMILFNSVKYYEKHCKIIPGLEFSSFSFDTALQYEFKDPWCKENYAFVEEISLYLKYKSQALQKKYRPGISTIDLYLFIKKATSYRIEVLNRTVQDDYPDKGKVMCWCEEAIGKIKRIL